MNKFFIGAMLIIVITIIGCSGKGTARILTIQYANGTIEHYILDQKYIGPSLDNGGVFEGSSNTILSFNGWDSDGQYGNFRFILRPGDKFNTRTFRTREEANEYCSEENASS